MTNDALPDWPELPNLATAPALPLNFEAFSPAAREASSPTEGASAAHPVGDLAKMLPLLAIAAKTGGRAGIAGFLQGVQRARAAKQQQARLGQQDVRAQRQEDRLASAAQRNEDLRQQELMLRAEEQRRSGLQGKRTYLESARSRLDASTTPAEFDRLLQQEKMTAPLYGVDPSEIDALIQRPEAKWRQAQDTRLRERLASLDAQVQANPDLYSDTDLENMVLSGEGVTVGEARKRTAYLTNPQTGEAIIAKPHQMTWGDLYPKALGTEWERRPAPTKRAGVLDIEQARLFAESQQWVPRTGRSQSGQTDAERNRVKQAAITTLRDKLKVALRNPQGANLGTIRANMAQLGLDWDVEKARAAGQIEREDLATVRARDLAGASAADVPTAATIMAGAEDVQTPVPSPGAGRGRGAGPGTGGGVPPARRTATRAQVEAVAKAQGVAYAEAKRQLEARNVVVVE